MQIIYVSAKKSPQGLATRRRIVAGLADPPKFCGGHYRSLSALTAVRQATGRHKLRIHL